MEVSSLGLLLGAAVLHALANLFLKQSRDKLAFTWWMLGASSVLGMPCWLFVGDISREGRLFILASGLLEAVYFFALSRAYTHGDLSQVYPIARGSAPLFIVVWAGIFLGERPSALGLLGIVSIVVGIYLINLPTLAEWRRPLLHLGSPATRWALLTGMLISVYMVTDKAGVKLVDPTVYLYLVLFVTWVVLSPMWFIGERRRALLNEVSDGHEMQRGREALRILSAASVGVVAYLLVLMALRPSPVGYVGAVREVSVVFGTFIGVQFLKERGGSVRVLASILVFGGILLIAVGG